MIIRIEATHLVCVVDAMDFQRFKIVCDLGRLEYERAKEAAAGLIEFESPDKAWVSAAALEEHVDAPQREIWRPEFDRMIDKARPHWLDQRRPAAHRRSRRMESFGLERLRRCTDALRRRLAP
jgi:hypothetical protein